MGLYLGLDIGGTKLMVASADEHGRILQRVRQDTPSSLEEGLQRLDAMIAETAPAGRIDGIGVAIGGPLDWRTGVVAPVHQPTWKDLPLKAILERKWGCPVWIDVDTNVAALGEYRLGRETVERFLYLTISTGMGGGFIVDGHVYRGSDGAHPEAAHISINHRCANPSALVCDCGASDCLEALVSGSGIRRIYGKPAESLADAEWDEVAYNLGQGLRNMTILLCPDVISLGGGISIGRGEKLLAPARAVMEQHLRLVRPPLLRLSTLGYDTSLLGAISIAIHGF